MNKQTNKQTNKKWVPLLNSLVSTQGVLKINVGNVSLHEGALLQTLGSRAHLVTPLSKGSINRGLSIWTTDASATVKHQASHPQHNGCQALCIL